MELAPYIDYTLLKQTATQADIEALCKTAVEEEYFAVCVNPYYVPDAKSFVKGSKVKVASVVGFPLGQNLMLTKWAESLALFDAGVDEIDVVANIGALKSGRIQAVREELLGIGKQCEEYDVVYKVIIESGLLDYAEIDTMCAICVEAGADFVKTSTGFAGVGAELEKVKHMREVLPAEMKIKASGGIRSRETAIEFINAGANRIGTSTKL